MIFHARGCASYLSLSTNRRANGISHLFVGTSTRTAYIFPICFTRGASLKSQEVLYEIWCVRVDRSRSYYFMFAIDDGLSLVDSLFYK